MPVEQRIKAAFYPERPGRHAGNIIWADRNRGNAYYRVSAFAMRNGRFPSNHPVAPGGSQSQGSECGESEALRAFRSRGYWASCFPEGDGITWTSRHGQTDAQALTDIRECFPMLEIVTDASPS